MSSETSQPSRFCFRNVSIYVNMPETQIIVATMTDLNVILHVAMNIWRNMKQDNVHTGCKT